jgi:hypothetical protein
MMQIKYQVHVLALHKVSIPPACKHGSALAGQV